MNPREAAGRVVGVISDKLDSDVRKGGIGRERPRGHEEERGGGRGLVGGAVGRVDGAGGEGEGGGQVAD